MKRLIAVGIMAIAILCVCVSSAETIPLKSINEEESLPLSEALKMLDESEDESDEFEALQNLCNYCYMCSGYYLQPKDADEGKYYFAEVSFELRFGTLYANVEHSLYSDFFGKIEPGKVVFDENDEYPISIITRGFTFSGIDDFVIKMNKSEMNIVWADGVNDYTLKKSNADEVANAQKENEPKPFIETETYQDILGVFEKHFGQYDYVVRYDQDTYEFFVTVKALQEGSRTILMENPLVFEDDWSGLMDGYKNLSGSIADVVSLSIREKVLDIKTGHCTLIFVDKLNDDNKYLRSEMLAMIRDGDILYDVVREALNDYTTKESAQKAKASKPSEYATAGEKAALELAGDYLAIMAFSREGLIGQLEYEGYSYNEAVYAADHCGADWSYQAVKKAREYLDFMSFSRDDLYDQLVFEGFTEEEARFGVSKGMR